MEVTSYRGLLEWMAQRVTALLIGVYGLFILIYILSHQPLSFMVWTALFHHFSIKIFTLLALLSVLWHAWIGLWTVLTDYIQSTWKRWSIETLILILLGIYLVWGLQLLFR